MIKIEDIVTNKAERNYSQLFDRYGHRVLRTEILPGHYYNLNISIPNFNENWIPRTEEEWNDNPDAYITNREYYDMSPVGPLFYHDNWKEVALILNFKVIPPKYRPAIMQAHLNLIEQSLERINWFDKNVPTTTLQDRRDLNLPLYRVTPNMLQELTGLKLGWAISGYKLDRISNAKLIDWDNIGELPYANVEIKGIAMSPGLTDYSVLFDKFENKQLI